MKDFFFIFQTRQRRQIHQQTMNSVSEQLEDQYQIQTISQIKNRNCFVHRIDVRFLFQQRTK